MRLTGERYIRRALLYCWIAALLFSMFSVPSVHAAEKTIGVIMTGNVPYYKEIHKAFIEELSHEGLIVQGKTDVVLQSPTPDPMSWTNAARKLVAIGSSVIVSYGTPATLAALSETSDIPIVFAGVYDPQAAGLAGKNATGISSKVPVASLVKNLKGISNFSKLGVVYNDAEKDTVQQAGEVKQLEGRFGFQATLFNVKRAGDAAKIAHVDALFLTTSCSAMQCVDNVVGAARKAKMPVAAMLGGEETKGIILAIYAEPHEQGREAARMAAKVVKGAKPSTLPAEQPKKVDMIINLKEATEMGFKVPFDILTSATRVIK